MICGVASLHRPKSKAGKTNDSFRWKFAPDMLSLLVLKPPSASKVIDSSDSKYLFLIKKKIVEMVEMQSLRTKDD